MKKKTEEPTLVVKENEHLPYDRVIISYDMESNEIVYGRVNVTWKHIFKMVKHKLRGKVLFLVTPFSKPNKFRLDVVVSHRPSLYRRFFDWVFGINDEAMKRESIYIHNQFRKYDPDEPI